MGLEEYMLGKLVDEIQSGIDVLIEKERYLCALVMLYSAIDGLSALKEGRASKGAFREWSRLYILKDGHLPCTDIDLYSARCSILHTFTQESDISRTGKAKTILYAWSDDELMRLRDWQGSEINTQDIIDGRKFVQIFKEGIILFCAEVNANKNLYQAIHKNLFNVYARHTLGPSFSVLNVKM